jgi:2-dehydro-3-deoxygalactonokinase
MTQARFIAGDWGTSRLRLFLCDAAGAVLARAEGPGVAQAGDVCARVLAERAEAWDPAGAPLPAILSGMVGSTIGWREAPYAACPVRASDIARAALRFESEGRAIAIVPGLSCRNPSGVPDVMRGEETQIAGALRLGPELEQGRQLLCLPGTHAKWVLLEDGKVIHFQSTLSGEVFDLLSRHSVLARGSEAGSTDHPAFAAGVALAKTQSQAGLLHLLFSTRSRQLAGEIPKAEAASYLSGLIVSADVAGALALFQAPGPVTLVCTPALGALYGRVLQEYAVPARLIDGDKAAHAGLVALFASLEDLGE